MAKEIITLEDATVTGIYKDGAIVHATISNESNGKTFTKKWTLWFKETNHQLGLGDVFTVTGFPSDKVGEPFTGSDGVERQAVERSINLPKIVSVNQAADSSFPSVNPDTPF